MNRIETEYNKETDTTYIFNVTYFGGIMTTRSIIGFYYGEPDENETNNFCFKSTACFDIWEMLKEYDKPIYKNRLKKWMSDHNENLQESIICVGDLDSALKYSELYNYEKFSNILELLEYYGKYAFVYDREIYFILFDNALNVYR